MNAITQAIEPQQFRAIMRGLASGVTVITTSREGHIHGMTATAFSSVSVDPPTVLVVLNKSTRTHPLVRAARRFAVNLLAEHQVELSNRFSGKQEAPFDGVAHELSEHGVPLLSGVLATLECETIQEMDVGTHTIFIGGVIGGARSDDAPLVYHDGSYKFVRVASTGVAAG
jgi:flavin reductase (DIM6/NTAB) family NADH-FMN oxidoreductase RutF